MKICSILLVNDDQQVIASIHEALAAVRHRLIIGPTAQAAVAAMNERRCGFDALLVDLDVGSDGLVLLNAVRSCCPRLPLIALSPSDGWFLKEEAFLRGESVLVDKPVTTDEVATAVQDACGCPVRRRTRSAWLDARQRTISPRGMRR